MEPLIEREYACQAQDRFKYHSTPNSACSAANKTERTLPSSIEQTIWPIRPYHRHCADLCIKVARNELSD